MRKSILFSFVAGFSLVVTTLAQGATTVQVPGTANPWLAGMPNGTRSPWDDSAPANSPVLVPGLILQPGARLTFNVTGSVTNDLSFPLVDPPDGANWWPQHNNGVENGIGNIFRSRGNALMGVFLTDQRPDTTPAPPTLDFQPGGNVPGGINYLSFAPQLKQPFFIGDGRTDTNIAQEIIVPNGATRLFLGTMDSVQWANNWGSFTVTVVPEPASLSMAIIGLAVVAGRSRLWRRIVARG